MKIRTETREDYATVYKLNVSAFGQNDEAELVTNLRQNPDYISELSLVAEQNGKIVGHILFTPVTIVNNDADTTEPSLALAPMAVLPEHQHNGIGAALIAAGFQKAVELGYTSVIVLGHPEYYLRFGFLPAEQFSIHPPVAAWKEAFFAKELVTGALAEVSGSVRYLPEFGIQ